MLNGHEYFISIIDYGMGNLFSVKQACEYVGLNGIITSDGKKILKSDGAILPGVGAFGDAMASLDKVGLISIIADFIKSGRPFIGICLGMQLLFTESEEFGRHKGLDIIRGSVVRFPVKDTSGKINKVPQVGWNRIEKYSSSSFYSWDNTPLRNIQNGEFMYFVHSYYCKPQDDRIVLSVTDYGGTTYCSSISWNNVFATQFHPEKSARAGMSIYKNWARVVKRQR